MHRSLTNWLAIIALVVGAIFPRFSWGQVVMSFTDDRDPSYPIGTTAEEDPPAATPSASDRQPEAAVTMTEPLFEMGGAYVPRNWVSTDYMVWWTKGNALPALLTTSPAGTPQAAAGVLPGATTLFGGSSIDDEQRHGLRATFGHWADDEGTIGWQVTYMGAFDDEHSGDLTARTTAALGGGTGAPILARPFYNVGLAAEDARLVSFPGLVDGSIAINSSSEMHTVSWVLRQHLRSGTRGRIDLLGGYRYFRLRDALSIQENLVVTGGVVPAGTTIAISDRFLAENDFHGGDLGFVAEFWNAGVSLELLAKVALGNLRRSADIVGSTAADTPPAGGAVTTNGGLLALPTNSGHRSANDFAALPEFGLNLKYEMTRDLSLNVGYSLLMLNDVVRSGELIDRNINTTQLSGGALVGAARPASQFANETDFWAQGISFGVTITR